MNTLESPKPSQPQTLILRLTKQCNMACPWCVARTHREHTDLDIPWTERTMESLWRYYEKERDNIVGVSITGGEPLLEYSRLHEIITHVRKLDVERDTFTTIIVHTNATLLTPAMRDFFNEQSVGINVSLKIAGYKGLFNLIAKSPVHSEVFSLIDSINNYAVRYVPERRADYAEDILFLHLLFPHSSEISIAPDETLFAEWTEEDIEHEIAQLRKLVLMSPDFPQWGAHINTLSEYTQRPSRFVCFHGTGDVTDRYEPGLVTCETNEQFKMPHELAAKLKREAAKIMLPKLENHQFPLNIQILTNLNCNLACTYCYECKGRGKNDVAAIKRFIKARYEDAGVQDTKREVILDFIGGESLLYPEMLDEISAYASQLHWSRNCTGPLTISISTNGTRIAEDKKVQEFLLKWRPHLGFSIDGTKAIHDDCRIDADGNPTYDRAVAGWKWAKEHLCPKRMGVKATYCHKTIDRWAQGVINLIELGFTDIAANVVFEEEWTLEEALPIARQMCTVVDYLFQHQLEDTVHIFQINNKDVDMRRYIAKSGPKEQNHCGTCTHMLCLGFDGKLYGCNRFCTMPTPISIGHMDGDKIVIDREDFCAEVARQYELWPDECKQCPYGQQCPSCSAIPYEQDGPEAFFARKPQCGFTHAMVAARLYFKMKLLERDAEKNKK